MSREAWSARYRKSLDSVKWSALMAISAPQAAVATFASAVRAAVAAAAAVLVAGIAGQVSHTGLFFVPALAVLVVAGVRLWREGR